MKKLDPRWFLFLNHFLLIILGILLFNFHRSYSQVIAAVVGALVAESIFVFYKDKNFKDLPNKVLSSFVTGLGIVLLVYSRTIEFYFLASFIGITSKYLVLNAKKEHIYNPSCFAIVFAMAFLPGFKPHYRGDQFLIELYPTLQVLFFGILATVYANRWRITSAYYFTLISVGFILELLNIEFMMNILGPELGVTGLVLAFLFVTDPRTSPQDNKLQFLFGALYGVFNISCKLQYIHMSNFISLFLLATLWPFISNFYKHKLTESKI